MSRFLAIILIFTPLTSFGVTWKVFGPCSDRPAHQGKYSADLLDSVGQISIDIFEVHQIPYEGGPAALTSVIGTPVGLDSIEVLSNRELRAYGWCYAVNGTVPPMTPDQVQLKSQSDTISWFYAYSTNLDNQWTDYCVPAYWVQPAQFCAQKR